MKREYSVPEIAVVMFVDEDIITASSLADLPDKMEDLLDWETLLGMK